MMHRSSSTATGSKKKKMPIVGGVSNGWKALVSVPVVTMMAFFVIFCALMTVGVDAAGAAGPPKEAQQQPKNGSQMATGGAQQPAGDGKESSEEGGKGGGRGGGKDGAKQGPMNPPPQDDPAADPPSSPVTAAAADSLGSNQPKAPSTGGAQQPAGDGGIGSSEEGGRRGKGAARQGPVNPPPPPQDDPAAVDPSSPVTVPSSVDGDGTPGSGDPPVTEKPGMRRHVKFQNETMAGKTAAEYKCVNTGDNANEFCGCVVKSGDKWTTIPNSFQFPSTDLECGDRFYEIAMMPICGNDWFDQMKLCALANFYGDKEPGKSDAVKDEHQKMLIMLDGCFTSSKPTCTVTKLRVTHKEPGGGLFSYCSNVEEWGDGEKGEDGEATVEITVKNEEEESGGTEADAGGGEDGEAAGGEDGEDSITKVVPITINTASFTVPAVLQHRVCSTVFSTWTESEKYENVKLHITHDCNDEKKTVIDLPGITLNEFKNRYAELRGLHVDLDKKDGDLKQFVRQENAASFEEKGNPGKWDGGMLNEWLVKKGGPEATPAPETEE